MKFVGKFVIFTWFLSLLPLTAAHALEVVAEWRFESLTGEPAAQEMVFSGQGFADFVLKVQNGATDGSNRVSSATLSLNDVRILGPADFNQKVDVLERAIAPLESGNSLKVNLRSNPGSFLVVQVLGSPTFNLPPDPGAAGDATLEGVDVNGNGIRDDIERWIYLTYPNSEKLRMALIQEYYPMQNMIIHARQQDRDAVYNDMDAMMRSGECLHYIHPEKPHKISAELESLIVNTDERVYGYLDASRMLGGGTFHSRHPDDWKNSCTFDPDKLNN